MGTDSKITSQLAKRQIDLFRFDAGLISYALANLKAADKQIKKEASVFDGELTAAQAKSLKRSCKEILHDAFSAISHRATSDIGALGEDECVAVGLLLASITGKKQEPVEYYGKATINGLPLDEHFLMLEQKTVVNVEQAINRSRIDHSEVAIAGISYALLTRAYHETRSLIRTGTQSIASSARMRVYHSDIRIRGYIHTSVLDNRTTVQCIARANAVWDVNYQPIQGTVEPFMQTPLHYGCRSFIRPWYGDEIEGMTGEQWIDSLTPDEQDRVFGVGRADLWRREVITWADLLDQSGRPLTLRELRGIHH